MSIEAPCRDQLSRSLDLQADAWVTVRIGPDEDDAGKPILPATLTNV